MFLDLRENKPHGSAEYPYCQYYICGMSAPFQFPIHWHNEFEIIIVRHGTLNVWINGQDYVGREGSIFLVNPQELHLMGSDDLSAAYYTLLFPLEFISFQTMDGLDMNVLMPLRGGALKLSHEVSGLEVSERLRGLLAEAIDLNREGPSFRRQIRTRVLLLEALDLLLEAGAISQPTPREGRSDTKKELLTYIQEHYKERLTLEDLASRFYMSPKYLSRFFSLHFHITFVNYLNFLRLSQARALLETSGLPVTDVAMEVGFSSVNYFIRLFKEKYGVTPLQYRRRHLIYGSESPRS